MNQDWKFDDLLKQGLLLAALKDTETPHQYEEVTFSRKYQEFRKKLLKDPFRYAKRKKRPVWKKVLQTAACLLLVSVIALGAVMVISPSARAEIIQWIRTVSNIDVSYGFFAEPTNQMPPRYEIGALPEGYAESERLATPKAVYVTYQNEEGSRIYFQYMRMEEGVGTSIDTRGAVISDIEVNGCKGFFYFFPDGLESNEIVWIDETANLVFCLDMLGEKDMILHIAESIFLSKYTNS